MTAKLSGLSFSFPVYDEETHVEPMVESALAVLPRFADELDITIVDDGSHDRTGEIADALAARHPSIRVVHHRPNRGYGAAVRSGLAAGTQPYLFFTDGDRQFDLADLALLIDALDERADLAIGYRLKRSDPFRRRFIGRVYNLVISLLFGGGFRDVDCGFKLFRREVFERVPLSSVRSDGAFFSAELLVRCRAAGLRIAQVGVRHYPRTAHEAKGAPPKVILKAIRDLLVLRARLGSRRRL